MVSINTNLSSLMVQGNLNQATNGLNKAIERLSTGYKINHSSDNAANYSIANNYEAKLSSYDMAADNVGMGSDLLAVAQDTISSMQDHGARLHALITQARNGTYGAQSLQALTQEAGALISEIQRMYSNAEYNKVSLFDNLPLPEWAKEVKETAGLTTDLTPKYNGFIENPETYTKDEVAAMTRVSDVDTYAAGTKYSIYTKEELATLVSKVNEGKIAASAEFVLGDDIDLSDIENWTPIGNSSHAFGATFNGNGHVIRNVHDDRVSSSYQGIFGQITHDATIKNVGVEGVYVKGKNHCGALVGCVFGKMINCYAKDGNVNGSVGIGGIVGQVCQGTIDKSWADIEVNGIGTNDSYGQAGLVGVVYTSAKVKNSYATGNVNGKKYVGGLAGHATGNTTITNCYATGDVFASNTTAGGLLGYGSSNSNVYNSYATGNVTSSSDGVGGLIGQSSNSNCSNSYAIGNVKGKNSVGGLIGYSSSSVSKCYSTSNVSGNINVGGLVGGTSTQVDNSFAEGVVEGSSSFIGGLIGRVSTIASLNYENLFSSATVKGESIKGSLIGGIVNTNDGETFGNVNIVNAKSLKQDMNTISGTYSSESGNPAVEYDISNCLNNIKQFDEPKTTIQVGIHGDESSKITFNTGFEYDLSAILRDIKSDDSYNAINKFMSTLSDKATELGSVSNRLESALDSIVVNMENITSSLSTIKDADMATESSQYIKMQILQQASATLLATANQSPSIALQLI